ncbi:MAG: glycoside hydrolase family 97 C-terminal domain-containing protein, partial [Reichenbachiella sp.]
PGAMINAQEENFRISWNRPMSMGTRCHQLAMYAIFESPLQMLCDNPSNYLREDESTAFLAQFPTVWDDIKVLEAKIGDYVALARRSGDSWYLGAMTDEKARTIAIDLSFLEDGNYNIEIFQDGVNAERYAQDYKRVVKNITNKDVIPASLANGGGWAAIITKK